MFFWKKDKTNKAEAPLENILTIPEEFYGAKDPVIHYNGGGAKKLAPAVDDRASVAPRNDGAAKEASKAGSRSGFLQNKKLVYVIAAVVFLAIVGLISWFYFSRARGSRGNQVSVVPQTKQDEKKEKEEKPAEPSSEASGGAVEEQVVEAATSTEAVLEEELPAEASITLEFPTILLVNGADIDSDALTDLEEEIFGTDSGTWDTDSDGYYDGQEVFNLYNPAGLAPMRIIDSGLAKEYVNSSWQYRIYYPATWQAGEVDAEKKTVLFSSVTGDFIEVFVSQKIDGETFQDWFAREAASQNFVDLQVFTNRFQESGWKRKDDLVAYFVGADKVFVVLYNPGVVGSISFRHVMQMMLQSFRPEKTGAVIPAQTVLPSPQQDAVTENKEATVSESTGESAGGEESLF